VSIKSMRDALNEALHHEFSRDPSVFLIGEDVGGFEKDGVAVEIGGVFGVSKGLFRQYGRRRVIDTPISEAAIVGAAAGAALCGMRPIAEIMFADLTAVCFDQIVNQIAKFRYMFGGQCACPLVIRMTTGGGRNAGAQHSQTFYPLFTSFPGLKVVVPSNAYDAKGLLITAIRDEDPVLFFEPKVLYTEKCEVPDEAYAIPFGEAAMPREGEDVTIVAFGQSVHWAVQAADELRRARGIRCDVIDPRTPSPLDEETILESVASTGRLVVVDESPPRCGLTADVSALVADKGFRHLRAPIKMVTAPHTPVPQARELERAYLPNPGRIIAAVEEVLE
jgi:pyruvate/2-oxoglutarate/acetoin dehydrogenase E1 component